MEIVATAPGLLDTSIVAIHKIYVDKTTRYEPLTASYIRKTLIISQC